MSAEAHDDGDPLPLGVHGESCGHRGGANVALRRIQEVHLIWNKRQSLKLECRRGRPTLFEQRLPIFVEEASVILNRLSSPSISANEHCDDVSDLLVTILWSLSLSCFRFIISFWKKEKIRTWRYSKYHIKRVMKLTLILITVSFKLSNWWAELSASSRMSVRTKSFSRNCLRNSSTSSGPSQDSPSTEYILKRKYVRCHCIVYCTRSDIFKWFLLVKRSVFRYYSLCVFLYVSDQSLQILLITAQSVENRTLRL